MLVNTFVELLERSSENTLMKYSEDFTDVISLWLK